MKITTESIVANNSALITGLRNIASDTTEGRFSCSNRYWASRAARACEAVFKTAQEKETALFKTYGTPHGAILTREIERLRESIKTAKNPLIVERTIAKMEARLEMYSSGSENESLIVEESSEKKSEFDAKRKELMTAENEIEFKSPIKIIDSKLSGDELFALSSAGFIDLE